MKRQTKKKCQIDGCERPSLTRGWCGMHHQRWCKHGDPLALKIAPRGTATRRGYRLFAGRTQHGRVAERALGKPLPEGAIVHHINENRADNRPCNLLICTTAYHNILHRRLRAYKASGHADWRRRYYCRRYSDPRELSSPARSPHLYHRQCRHDHDAQHRERTNARDRARYAARKASAVLSGKVSL